MNGSLGFSHCLKTLPVYQPGRPIEEVARELGLPVEGILKLASNENPLGPSPAGLEAIRKALPQLHRYPDGNAFYLKQKLARKYGVETPQLTLGNGSNEILELIGHALLNPGDEVVVSEYCFAVYPIVAHLFGARLVTIPARNQGHDLPAMLRAMTPLTKLVFVANPNNPTGTLAPADEVRRLVEETPQHVLVVIDEAYIEFLEDPVDLLPLIRSGHHSNLMLLRTFSKIHGLAGLRVGYGFGHPEIISALEKVREPFNVNSLAQVAAMAALDDAAHIQRTRENNRAGQQFLAAGFRRLKLEFIPSQTNFVMARVGPGQRVFESLQRQGVIARPLGGYGLPEWLRISVGIPDENARCLTALQQALAEQED